MTFYFKPPRGTITLQTIHSCIKERLKYVQQIESLDDISDIQEPLDAQFLLDGSAFDRTGHFMLRLLSLKVNNILHFYKRKETALFKKRLRASDPYQVRIELKTVYRHITEILETSKELPQYKTFLVEFLKVCQQLSQREWANHAFCSDHPLNCEDYCVEVPFTLCLPLVQEREVELKRGNATIPCGKWQQFLECLFQIHLDFGLDQLKFSQNFKEAFLDDRVEYIAEMYRNLFRSYTSDKKRNSTLKSDDIDGESAFFPPCMASLHKVLRQRHRLTHDARFHYSLFLKDIGLPIEEANKFWRKEYSQPHTGCASCSHSWQKDGKRYLYSIRHLYGLEGARKNYRIPCCKQIQNSSLGSNSEGGCPFVHYDDNKLISSFCDGIRRNSEAVQSLLTTNRTVAPQLACQKYFSLIQELNCKQQSGKMGSADSPLENPAKFYHELKLLDTDTAICTKKRKN